MIKKEFKDNSTDQIQNEKSISSMELGLMSSSSSEGV